MRKKALKEKLYQVQQALIDAQTENESLRIKLESSKTEIEKLNDQIHKMLIAAPELVDIMKDIMYLEDDMRLREESKTGLAQLRKECRNLKETIQYYSDILAGLIKKVERRQTELSELEDQVEPVKEFVESFEQFIDAFNNVFQTQYSADAFFDSILHDKLNRTWGKGYRVQDLTVEATILSPEEKPYQVTLSSCNCKDREYHSKTPCKHMVLLAYTLGFLQYEYVNEETTSHPNVIELRKASQNLHRTSQKKSMERPSKNQ